MITIQNEQLCVRIAKKGAELRSVVCNGAEYMWQRDPAVWGDAAPLLFPVVGQQLDFRYTYKGKEYTMPLHGFARDYPFAVTAQSDLSVSMVQTENPETLERYPFPYRLESVFELEGDTLVCHRFLTNTGEEDMLYSLGEHPGFCIPSADSGCYLRFSEAEKADRWVLDDEIIDHSEPFLDGDTITVTPELFNCGALIFKKINSSHVTLHREDGRTVTVGLDGWDHLGVWAFPNQPYVCIEPWCGITSSKWSTHELTEKESIHTLKAGETVHYVIRIRFH